MAMRNQFLVDWVKNAYSMELALVPILEQQSGQIQGDHGLRTGLDQHLQKTREHVNLLRNCLQRMGENPANIRPAEPVLGMTYRSTNGGGPDVVRQAELFDYVAESFEVASYRALGALADMAGDRETSQVCQKILQDELAMTHALDQRLPREAQGTGPAGQDNVGLVRDNFDALNAHDLDRWERHAAPDFRGEGPGAPGDMDRKQNREYLQGYMTAFPDLHFVLDPVVSSGNYVAVPWTCTGTHSGPLRGPDGSTIPPTNKKCVVPGITYFECNSGKITHARAIFDRFEIMRQLGLAGVPATSGETNRSIVHIEIPAASRQAAAQFYKDMFGWETQDMGDEMRYTTFRTGNVGGGFPDLGDMYKAGDVVFYVESQDIESDLRRAERMGGKVLLGKTDIPGMGYFAFLADPTGNRIGLYTGQIG